MHAGLQSLLSISVLVTRWKLEQDACFSKKVQWKLQRNCRENYKDNFKKIKKVQARTGRLFFNTDCSEVKPVKLKILLMESFDSQGNSMPIWKVLWQETHF